MSVPSDNLGVSEGLRLLQAGDAPAGTTPKVFLLQVSTAGTLVVTPVALGGGNIAP